MTITALSGIVIAVSALAVWHRSTIGWIVAGLANVIMAWVVWTG